MATVSVTEIITRAALAADMHDNFVNNPAWLYWLNVENRELCSRLVRLGFPYGLTSSTIVTTGATSYTIAEPLAIVNVYRNETDGTFTKIKYRSPVNKIPNFMTSSLAKEFTALYNPTAGTWSIYFYPTPPADGINYTIDYIPYPTTLTLTSNVYFPLNWDERLVLGIARRALAREETSSANIEMLIKDIDSHIEDSAYDYLLSQNNTVSKVDVRDLQPFFVFP